MEIKKVFLGEILIKPDDLKLTGDYMAYYKISDSIKEYGQLKPVICYRTSENSGLLLLDGRLIIRALKYLGQDTAFILDLGIKTEQEALQIWCALNLNQRSTNYIELAKKIKAYPEIKKALSKQTTLLPEEIDSLEKILDFDWSCFAKAKQLADGPNLFEGLEND